MKKSLLLFVFALAAMAPQAWAVCTIATGGSTACCIYDNDPENCWGIGGPNDKDGNVLQTATTCEAKSGVVQTNCEAAVGIEYCFWGSGCYKIKDEDERDNCELNGSIYADVPPAGVGKDKKCEGGEWVGGRAPDAEVLGCCLWDTETACNTIWSGPDPYDKIEGEVKVIDCKGGSNKFWTGQCVDSDDRCPTTAPVWPLPSSSGTTTDASSSSTASGDGGSSSSGGGGSSSSGGGSQNDWFCVYSTEKFCTSGHAENYTCPNSGLKSHDCPAGFDGGTPIVLSRQAHRSILSAMHNAVNLQVMSNATVQIFDLKGNAIRTLTFKQGNYIVPMSGLPRGLYVVKASEASWKQTIKVIVK